MRAPLVVLLGIGAAGIAWAEDDPKVPDRQIPPSVVAGLRVLEHQFAQALAQDCAPERCFAKGCVYVAHTVVDQPAVGSLPGLDLAPGPGSVPSQIYLTTAECSFAHERSVRTRDARALATRLRAKLSRGWTQVDVSYETLQALPAFLRESPEPPPEPVAPVTAAPQTAPAEVPATAPASAAAWDGSVAARELWEGLLPHFAWMIGLLLFTVAALLIIWAIRRLGRPSPEDEALLAQMIAEPPPEEAPSEPPAEPPPPSPVSARYEAWRERLADAPEDDPVLRALVADLLRAGERRQLAKAVMLFPEAFPKAFPQGGALASAKYALAEFLKTADPASLPPDADFFDALDRYALASALTAHPDTELIRTLHDELGATALVDVMGAVPSRYGALLFALAPAVMQHEAIGLLSQRQLHDAIGQLLRSNRMDPVETTWLMEVLEALRAGAPLPSPPEGRAVSDRGAEFDAAGALSILLPRLEAGARQALIAATVARHNGRLPAWVDGTVYGEMLLHLDAEARADLLLEVSVEPLAAWLHTQTAEARGRLLAEAPLALRAALSACAPPAAPVAAHALADEARAALVDGLRRAGRRLGLPLQTLLS